MWADREPADIQAAGGCPGKVPADTLQADRESADMQAAEVHSGEPDDKQQSVPELLWAA